MMTKEQLEDLYDEQMGKVYSEAEYALHSSNRPLKGLLEVEHNNNFAAIDDARDWTRFARGGAMPERKIWNTLRCGCYDSETRTTRLGEIVAIYARYEHGSCPLLPIYVYATRTGATLFAALDDLYPSNALDEARDQFRELIRLIGYSGKPKMGKDEFKAQMERRLAAMSSNFVAYVDELKIYLRRLISERKNPAARTATKGDVDAAVNSVEKKTEEVKTKVEKVQATAEETNRKADVVIVKQEDIRKTVNRIDKRDKCAKKNARRRFSVEVQEAVFGYWERGRDNMTLKQEAKRKVTYQTVFEYFKNDLIALGISDASVFKACLGARSDRIQRT